MSGTLLDEQLSRPGLSRTMSFSARSRGGPAQSGFNATQVLGTILLGQSNVPTADLRHSIEQLPPNQRAELNRMVGRHLEEFLALAAEPNPQMFSEGLLSLGTRLEQGNHLEAASAVFAALAGSDGPARERAEARLNAMNGVGSGGARAEFLLRRLSHEAMEPTALFGMGLASAAFKVTRLATLSRLAATPAGSFLTRGFGARATASVVGFGVEAAVFPMATRLGNVALGRPQDWSGAQLGRELAGSYIVLGAMKLTGWAGTAAFNRAHGVNPLSGQATRLTGLAGVTQRLVPQAGMLGGIMLGHQIETAVNLRPHLDGATTLIDSLGLLIQFNVAGNLTRHAFGERFHHWERALDMQSESMARRTDSRGGRRGFIEAMRALLGQNSVFAHAGNGRAASEMGAPDRLQVPNAVFMTSLGDGSGPGSKISFTPETSAEVQGALETYRVNRARSDTASITAMSEALKAILATPESREAARDALIGVDPARFSEQQLNELYTALRPDGLDVLTNPNIKRVMIPNRGEIAKRLSRAMVAEGLIPIVLVARPEAESRWVQEVRDMGGEVRIVDGATADQAYADAYKNIDKLIAEHAPAVRADAVHPGYGFRSESPDFARALRQAGIVLMGPSERTMERAGDKDIAKQAFVEAGVPVVPGTERGYTDVEGLIAEIRQKGLTYPLRLKAVGGGGGRGQATVYSEAQLREKFPTLRDQVARDFGNGAILAERFISRFQHVEFQIMADRFGNVIHLGERECTLQERDQKLIEIHPAQIFERFPGLRERMAEASIRAAKAVNYTGHGTVEFMVDPVTGDFFAMEVNARIQVEHRVSEAVTGFDLVREAVRVARGLPLSRRQSEVQPQGAAVEIRIKAVNPNKRNKAGEAFPAPGLVEVFKVLGTDDFNSLEAQGIFVETAVRPGDMVANVDPMIAKIIVTGTNRLDAIERAAEVLRRTQLSGSKGFSSDLERQRLLLENQAVREGGYDNRYVGGLIEQGFENRAHLPYTRPSLLVDGGTLAPIHLEVASYHPIAEGAEARVQEALHRLIDGKESTDPFRLSGPVAELLRNEEGLRQQFRPNGAANSRASWVQLSPEGILRQAVYFENNVPRRVLVNHRAQLEYDKALAPVAYDIQLPASANEAPRTALYRLFPAGLELIREAGKFDLNRFVDNPDGPGLNLQVIPLRRQNIVELRDRRSNLMVSISPERIMEHPAQRLLALFELQSRPASEAKRQLADRQIDELIAQLASLPPGHETREETIRELGSTPQSIISKLLNLMNKDRPMAERAFVGMIMAYREIVGHSERHQMEEYRVLEPLNTQAGSHPDPAPSAVRFSERALDGTTIPRLMIRSRANSSLVVARTLLESIGQLKQLLVEHPERRDNVIQIVMRRPELLELFESPEAISNYLRENISEVLGPDFESLHLKRFTFIIDRAGDYPNYFTFRRAENSEGKRVGPFVEDTRYRDVHPMLAHFIELWRLDNFDLERDIPHSDRLTHLYFARNKPIKGLDAGKDFRLFGRELIPDAEVVRGANGELLEIPAVEAGFVRVTNAMQQGLAAKKAEIIERNQELPEDQKLRPPAWNRMDLHIQPILEVSDLEASAYAERLAIRHRDRLAGLGLEKVVVKARVRDERSPGGYRTILIRVTNPTSFRYVPTIHNIVRAKVEVEAGRVATREVLVRNGAYDEWLRNPDRPIPLGDWAPADIPVRPATRAEIREQQARNRGAVWAYRIPELIGQVAEQFRLDLGLGIPRPPGSEPPIEGPFHSNFIELELDPKSVRLDPRTQMIDYNHGTLIPAMDAEGRPRPMGENQAGVVIGIQTDNLGLGSSMVRRVVILGDLTHESRGALSANECARINAAIRYAADQGIPVDWYTASSGAEIDAVRGVEGLDATASVVREIVQNAQSLGVPINVVVDDVNIGAQSYWNSLSSIIHNTGGILIMTPRGSMALTGPDAWTAAMLKDTHSEDLPGRARSFYPKGLQSLAGYEEIHGPNGEAMAIAPNLQAATELLLRHHYYSYVPRTGDMVTLRHFGIEDSVSRPIGEQPSSREGRTVSQEIADILSGRAGDRAAILEALRDRGSPPPLRWWSDAQGIRHQPGGNGLMPQKYGSLIQEMQIGGRPTMAIFPPVGPLTPADSEIIARAIWKANGRMPVLIIGSLTGFNGDPRSMDNRQLFGGASIAEAIVHHQGPITVVDMGYIVGGTFVVVSKQLNPHLRFLAVQGAHAQVIGGPSAAKVVFRGKIRLAADADPRVRQAQAALNHAFSEVDRDFEGSLQRALQTAPQEAQKDLQKALAGLQAAVEARSQNPSQENQNAVDSALRKILTKTILDPVRREVISEIEVRRAAEFDGHHSVQRAQEVGAIDQVIAPADLRERIIHHQEEALREYQLSLEAQHERSGAEQVVGLMERDEITRIRLLQEGLIRIYGEAGGRIVARDLALGLLRFAGEAPEDPEGGAPPPGGSGSDGSSAPP